MAERHGCSTCRYLLKYSECTDCSDFSRWESVTPPPPKSAEPETPSVLKTFTSNDMAAFFAELQDAEFTLWAGKNKDYADHKGDGCGNTFANFEAIAAELDMKTEQIVWVYLRKQLQALLRYVNHGKLETEPLMNRIIDARNFLAILGGVARRKGDL